MFNLVIQVASKPVHEERRSDIAGSLQLHSDPVHVTIILNVHWQVVDLCHPHIPVTLQEPHKQEPSQALQNSTQKWGVHEAESNEEAWEPQKFL